MSFRNKTSVGVRALKSSTANTVEQLGHSIANNAILQGAINFNTTEEVDITSGISNPAKSHETEKYDVLEAKRDRIRGTLRELYTNTIIAKITPGLVRLTLGGGFITTPALMGGMQSILSSVSLKLGELKQNGWKLLRVADMYGVTSKFMRYQASSMLSQEAPILQSIAQIRESNAHLDVSTSDFKVTIAQNEMHRIAEAYGIDATFLTAVVNATLTLHAVGKAELASNAQTIVSGGLSVDINSAGPIKMSGLTHSIVDALGGSISIAGGIVNINPVIPGIPNIPTIVIPAVTAIPTGSPRQSEAIPLYTGTNPHDVSII